jgi:hypothetical protein
MLAQLRRRLTYANVVATLALFVAVSTGGAYAANTIFSADIVDGEVKTADLANEAVTNPKLKPGAVTTNRLAGGAVTTEKVKNENLTGTDVLDSTIRSADIAPLTITGFDVGFNAIEDVHVRDDTLTDFDIDEARLFHCHSGTILFGRLCAGGGASGTHGQAGNLCANIGLRLPTWGEAITLALNHDVPGVGAGDFFWTDEVVDAGFGTGMANPSIVAVSENAFAIDSDDASSVSYKIVCVETPTGLP